MSKSLEANVTAQLGVDHAVRLLVEIALDAATLYFAADKVNIVFPYSGGNTYTAKDIKVTGLSQDTEGQIGRCTIKLDNVSRDMSGYASAVIMTGRPVTIKRVYLDSDLHAPASADEYVEVFYGLIETIKNIDSETLQITATTGEALAGRAINKYYQITCNNKFGDEACNVDGNADLTSLTASGTADSGSTTTLVDSALTQANDFWTHGLIEITHGGILYRRIVEDFVAATDTITLDLALPITVDNTTTYVVYKGCDRTKATCGGAYAFGPSADNSLNFGGFEHATNQA